MQWQGPDAFHHADSHTDILGCTVFLLGVLLKARGYQPQLWVACLLKLEMLGQARTGVPILSVAAY